MMCQALASVGRLLRALTALTILAGFIVGVPWLLAAFIGWPLAWIGWPTASVIPGPGDLLTAISNPWSDDKMLAMFATLGWVLWLLFCRDVAVEVIEASAVAAATRRGQPRPVAPGRGPIRWVAAVLVGAIAGAVLLDLARGATGTGPTPSDAAHAAARPATVAAAPARISPPFHTTPVERVTLSGARPAIHVPAAHAITAVTFHATGDTAKDAKRPERARDVPEWAADAPAGFIRVHEGDTLWDIAEREDGDPFKWRDWYTASRGKPQPNGYTLNDPDELHVGWVLARPTRASAPAPPPAHTEPAPPPAGGAGSGGPARSATPPAPATPAPTNTAAPTHTATPTPTGTVSPAAPSASATNSPTTPPAATAPHDQTEDDASDRPTGITLPSQGWISLGLAATIAAVAALLRLHRRRRARLGFPIPVRTTPQPAPVPPPLAVADAAGTRELHRDTDTEAQPGAVPAPHTVAAPVGVDPNGAELSLFDLPGPGIALHGDGAHAAARAILASALATGVLEQAAARPVVVTTADTLAQLLPDGAKPTGLDPDRTSFDGERLIVLADTAAAVTHAEEEMIHRRRLLDSLDADTITALNARPDHAEHQPPYVLLIEGHDRYAARIGAVAAHRTTLHLHTVILGTLDGIPTMDITTDGTPTTPDAGTPLDTVGRLSTLGASDLAQVLAMLTEAAPRSERGVDLDDPLAALEPAPAAGAAELLPEIPAPSGDAPPLVRLNVLGSVTVTTEAGPVTTGMRSGSYTVLALLAAHPSGRTLEQIAATVLPDTAKDPAVNRVRTDITSARKVLRAAIGDEQPKFIIYDPAITRYRLDPDTIEVDLWRVLAAIGAANTATDDTACLAALQQAADIYQGDFAGGLDRAWAADYATTYRHQILNVYARIAELVEADQPDQAIGALERAVDLDPVNEELYQRIMRIHGRQHRPDAVRRTLRRLEERLADLGEAEPSEATRRVAERQLRPVTPGVHG